MLWLFLIPPILILLIIIAGAYYSEPGYKGPVSDHFDGKKFKNPSGQTSKGLGDVFKYLFTRKSEKWNHNYETDVRTEPVEESDREHIKITFVGHSSFLIQVAGINLLTDPLWSERCSPFSFAGPKRMRPPGIPFEMLPKIDAVLLSHNHYDHLDLPTLKKLERLYAPEFVTPLGVKTMLDKRGFKNTRELDWWQDTNLGELRVRATPANHFSSRGMFDRDKTLWCGFILEFRNFKTYFVGDTGYGDNFKNDREKIGDLDLALIPIGAYKPRWFMSPIHIDPEQALMLREDIGSPQSVAMHFGTFALADEGQEVAEADLRKAAQARGLAESDFLIPDEGVTLHFKINDKN